MHFCIILSCLYLIDCFVLLFFSKYGMYVCDYLVGCIGGRFAENIFDFWDFQFLYFCCNIFIWGRIAQMVQRDIFCDHGSCFDRECKTPWQEVRDHF